MSAHNNDSQVDIDNLLERLLEGLSIIIFLSIILIIQYSFFLEVRECHPRGKFVQMSEEEINFLCEKSKDIFLNQPMLLELEPPIKICGNIYSLLILKLSIS